LMASFAAQLQGDPQVAHCKPRPHHRLLQAPARSGAGLPQDQRLRATLPDCHPSASGPGMTCRHKQGQDVLSEGAVLKAGTVPLPADQPEVGLAPLDSLQATDSLSPPSPVGGRRGAGAGGGRPTAGRAAGSRRGVRSWPSGPNSLSAAGWAPATSRRASRAARGCAGRAGRAAGRSSVGSTRRRVGGTGARPARAPGLARWLTAACVKRESAGGGGEAFQLGALAKCVQVRELAGFHDGHQTGHQ